MVDNIKPVHRQVHRQVHRKRRGTVFNPNLCKNCNKPNPTVGTRGSGCCSNKCQIEYSKWYRFQKKVGIYLKRKNTEKQRGSKAIKNKILGKPRTSTMILVVHNNMNKSILAKINRKYNNIRANKTNKVRHNNLSIEEKKCVAKYQKWYRKTHQPRLSKEEISRRYKEYIQKLVDTDYKKLKLKRLLYYSKVRTKEKGFSEHNLTYEWLLKQGDYCSVTGIKFDFEKKIRNMYAPSIDRIDNDKGYTTDNCRLVIWAFNTGRGNTTDDVLYSILKVFCNKYSTP